MKKNHEPLNHAILVLEQMEIDLHRIAIQSDDAQGALIGDCAEHRSAMLNKLRHIAKQWSQSEPIATQQGDTSAPFIALDAWKQSMNRIYRKAVPSTAPESPALITPDQIKLNALEGNPPGDPEIAPESQSERIPSALAEYRRRQRIAIRAAWTIAILAAFAILAAIKFALAAI